jgi:nucleoside phosphorylase
MYFSASARLANELPALGDLPARLDELLCNVGRGDVLEPAGLASDLRVSEEQLERILAVAARAPVDLLVAERCVVCPTCDMLNPAEERTAAVEAGEDYPCSSCDIDLASTTVREVTHYRLSPDALQEAEERRAAEAARPKETAVVLTALPVEFRAVLAHLADVREQKHGAGTIYRVGAFRGEVADWTVALAVIGAGNPGAAAEAERAIAKFAPKAALFVGVAGGIKDVEIGDVVAASEIYLYHAGKADDDFISRPVVDKGSYALVQRAEQEAISGTWRERGGANAADRKAIVAPVAAGEQVVVSSKSDTYKLIRDRYDRAVAVEMEGSGFLRAAYANQDVQALVIRGISDLLQGKEAADASGSQGRAASHAAAFAFEVLAKL